MCGLEIDRSRPPLSAQQLERQADRLGAGSAEAAPPSTTVSRRAAQRSRCETDHRSGSIRPRWPSGRRNSTFIVSVAELRNTMNASRPSPDSRRRLVDGHRLHRVAAGADDAARRLGGAAGRCEWHRRSATRRGRPPPPLPLAPLALELLRLALDLAPRRAEGRVRGRRRCPHRAGNVRACVQVDLRAHAPRLLGEHHLRRDRAVVEQPDRVGQPLL